jgi:hypothetical protein
VDSLDAEDWAKLIDGAEASACHLEMRDQYAVAEEAADVEAWRAGTWTLEADAASKAGWLELMRRSRDRGVVLRRARIVSPEPTDYIRFEHFGTPNNIAAGEQVRWLWRTDASGLALPGNDFWVIDGRHVLFNHFTGTGGWLGNTESDDPAVARLCADAFEAVWNAGTSHEEFRL